MKRCPRCEVEKPETDFGVRKSGYRAGQLRPECRPCEAQRMKAWHDAHPEYRSEKRKAWRKRDREKHPEKYAKQFRDRRAKDPERFNRLAREWRARNPEKARAIGRRFYANHREERLAEFRARVHNDPVFAARVNLSTRIAHALRRNHGIRKSQKTLDLLGCSLVELRSHLEAKFQPGMSWDNYGAWHVDHIRPCASFDLSDPAQQRVCFHYTNLQPLWASDNFHKSAKLTWTAQASTIG